MSNPHTLGYRPDIDGLRAIAVLLVLVFHFSLLPAITGGFLGVDMFFVISGFLITSIVVRQLEAGQFSFRSFYTNRIRRLAPALFAVLAAVIGVGLIWLFPADLLDLSKQALAAQFYYANFYYWQNVNYFGLNAQNLPLLHTWSLAAEEQFYLVFPALLALLYRHFRRRLAVVLVGILAVSFLLNIFFVSRKPEAAFYLFPTRSWELLTGALLPVLSAAWRRTRGMDEGIAVLGIGLVIAAATLYRANFAIPGFFALVPTLGTGLLIVASLNHSTRISRCIGVAPIAYIGRLSYPLYLIHWPVNVFARQMIPHYSPGWRWVMLGVSIILSAAIYHLVENPVRQRRLLPSDMRLVSTYIVGLCVSLAVFAGVVATHGVPGRFPPKVLRLASYASDKPDSLSECEFASQPVSELPSCRLGAAGHQPRWLVVGDSHAWAGHAAFDRWLAKEDQAGLLAFRHACPPLTDIHFVDPKDSCYAFNESIMRFIQDHPEFDHILLVSTWKWPIDGGLVDPPHGLLTPAESVGRFTDRFVQTIHQLSDLHREVYVWEPVPGASRNVPEELARAALWNRPADIAYSLDEYRRNNQLFFDALARSGPWLAGSYSPSQVLCRTGMCAVAENDIPLYADTAHVTNSSADTWVRVLESGPDTHWRQSAR